MSDLSLYSVNWQDGMLITQQHLKDQERYFEDLIRWHTFDIGDKYGLVKKSHSGKPALSLNATASGNKLRVEVVRCQAITPDGTYIDIDDVGKNPVKAEATISESLIQVFISADPISKKQIGDADPSEDVPRIPYLANNYGLHLGNRPNLPEGRFIQLAELSVVGSEVSFSQSFFPPCLSVNADERLAQKIVDYRNRLENLVSLATQAFKSVTASGALSGESTTLQVAFKETLYLLVFNLSSTLDEFVTGRNAKHPLWVVVHFKRLFRVFSTLVNLHPGLKDYLNEKYFSKEVNSDIGRFISSIESFILADYNHEALGEQLRIIDDVLGNLKGILGFLAQTKREQLGEQAVATDTLTYSARTYRLAPYGSCRLEQAGGLSYLLMDITQPRPVGDTVMLMSKDLFNVSEWTNMQVRLGLNDARGLGETDPVDVDVTTFGNKVALHPRDMVRSSSVKQITLIFRGAPDPSKFGKLGKMDLIIYTL
jgi:hypothetical protein